MQISNMKERMKEITDDLEKGIRVVLCQDLAQIKMRDFPHRE